MVEALVLACIYGAFLLIGGRFDRKFYMRGRWPN